MSRKKKNTVKNDTASAKYTKWKDCKHALSRGTYAVFVDTGCRQAHMIKGTLLCTPVDCEKCEFYERKEAE